MKLSRLLDEIQKTEKKIEELQEHLKVLNMRRKQMEDAEIIKSIRSMRLGSREMLALLNSIQDGTVSIQYEKHRGSMETGAKMDKKEKEEWAAPEEEPESEGMEDGD